MRDFSIPHHYDTALQLADFFDEPLKPVVYLLYKKLLEGHICIKKNTIADELRASSIPAMLADRPYKTDFSENNPIIIDCGEHLYFHRYFQYESIILEKLKSFLAKGYSNVKNHSGFEMVDEHGATNWQTAAVIASLLHTFTIITGGPGTGKTTTVAKILAYLIAENSSLRIGLAAPTGKAAARMAESLRSAAEQLPNQVRTHFRQLEPLTIHRLLGPIKGSNYFRHNAANPLPYDVLIVDECSMIDTALFAKLLDAVANNCRLILLGDRNQLASVEAGSMFGDVCDAAGELNCFSRTMAAQIEKLAGAHGNFKIGSNTALSDHIIELQRSYRFSDTKGIGRMSRAIIHEDTDTVKSFLSNTDEEVMVDPGYDSEIFDDFALNFKEVIQEKDILLALKKLNHCKVLCATRDGMQGLYNTNNRIERVLEEKGLLKKTKDFYEHRPVMITKNNYALQLYNGDTGIVRADDNGKLKVWFEIENQLVGFSPSMISHCETAFAITIHKSQGSEFTHILVLLPENDLPILSRELIYTAITRAKTHVIIQSSEESLLSAVRRSVARGSGIKYRLQ